jgi:hypothetical protein
VAFLITVLKNCHDMAIYHRNKDMQLFPGEKFTLNVNVAAA